MKRDRREYETLERKGQANPQLLSTSAEQLEAADSQASTESPSTQISQEPESRVKCDPFKKEKGGTPEVGENPKHQKGG